MSGLVERLAAKWASAPPEVHSYDDDARWWLNAIAEELEDATDVEPSVRFYAANWLRGAAREAP